MGELNPGMLLKTTAGTATVKQSSPRYGSFDVYNLEVEGPHNYYVGDQKVLVHNKAMPAGSPSPNWTLGRFKSITKWQNQMAKRGWTNQQITEAIEKGQAINSRNAVNPGNSAARYIHPQTGRSVVIDNATGEIIHVGGDGFTYTHWDL